MPTIPRWSGNFNCPTGYIHTTHSSGSDHWVRKGCRDPACPDCWHQKAMAARLQVMEHLVHHKAQNMWLWTTSVRNSPLLVNSFSDLSETETRFRKADYARRRRGSSSTVDSVATWIGVYEVKRSKDKSWNVHSHKIVVGKTDRLPYGDLDRWWKQAAGDPAAHSDLEGPSKDPHSGAAYLTKYLGKDSGIWGSMSEHDALLHAGCLKGRRFLRRPRGSKPPVMASEYDYCCESIGPQDCYYDSR